MAKPKKKIETELDIDALVKGFSNELDNLDDVWKELGDGSGGSGGGGGNDDHGGGGGGGGGGDGDGDGEDDEQFYEDLHKRLTKNGITKEDEEALLQSAGIVIDKLPMTSYGHAIRMFRFAGGHLMRRTTSKSRTGEWIMYRPEMGIWGTEAADDLIINRALQVAFMFQRWSQQIGRMVADPESKMSPAKAYVLEMLAIFLGMEAEKIQKSKIPGIIRMGRAVEEHHISRDRFDTDHMKLAVANGVIDLRTGERLAHSPKNYITRHLNTSYIETARCPTWERFVEQAIPDPDVRDWVQRFAGYCLTGDTEEQVACFFHGPGGTGKSTFWNVVREILGGDFASQVHRGVFHASDFTRYASSTIVGLRLGVDSEWEDREILMTGKFRQLVGERSHTPEPKMAKLLGEVPITAKFVFLAQHLPSWEATDLGTSEAMRRRMFIVPMRQRLARSAYTSRAYLDLMPNLLAEREGILTWLVNGELMRHAQALHVNEPQVMQDARDQYFDAIGAITIDPIEEAVLKAGYRLDPALTTLAKDVIAAVVQPGITATALGRWLSKRKVTKKDTTGGLWYFGIGQ